jgi:sporulation protein YlmC with PRC-barrel domain
MLRSLESIRGHSISATDGEVGSVSDFVLDGGTWKVRYLVVNTGSWLSERLVLLPPDVTIASDWNRNRVDVALTREQVKNSPGIEGHETASQKAEAESSGHHGWSHVFSVRGGAAPAARPVPPFGAMPSRVLESEVPSAGRTSLEDVPRTDSGTLPDEKATDKRDEPRDEDALYSYRELTKYEASAEDGVVGKVVDVVVDDRAWDARYLVIVTGGWLRGRTVVVAPQWVRFVNWRGKDIRLDVTRGEVEGSPVFDPESPINRVFEERLYDYYGRPRYWD